MGAYCVVVSLGVQLCTTAYASSRSRTHRHIDEPIDKSGKCERSARTPAILLVVVINRKKKREKNATTPSSALPQTAQYQRPRPHLYPRSTEVFNPSVKASARNAAGIAGRLLRCFSFVRVPPFHVRTVYLLESHPLASGFFSFCNCFFKHSSYRSEWCKSCRSYDSPSPNRAKNTRNRLRRRLRSTFRHPIPATYRARWVVLLSRIQYENTRSRKFILLPPPFTRNSSSLFVLVKIPQNEELRTQ